MKKVIYSLLLFVGGIGVMNAQSIRKDYREMTTQEQADFVTAINELSRSDNTVLQDIAAAHSEHFTSAIHTTGFTNGSQFLAWHRFFLAEVEQYVRGATSSSGYLSLPYWDWTSDRDKNAANFWNNTFLKESNILFLVFSRGSMNSTFPPSSSASTVNTVLGYDNFMILPASTANFPVDFTHRLEGGAHNAIHGWVGGTMGERNSPLDPIFFLHHAMVDKVWQQWEDKTSGIQSVFSGSIGTTAMVHYNASMYPFNVFPKDQVDSRSVPRPANAGTGRKIDVWYAYNKKVILDGANGNPFVCNDDKPYMYRYVAATTGGEVEGIIYAGDVRRNTSDNIEADNKGGFEVNSGATCDFRAGGAVSFEPGFEAKAGSIVEAKIITTANELTDSRPTETFALSTPEVSKKRAVYGSPVILLLQNENGDITVQYLLPTRQNVSLSLQDRNGVEVKNLVNHVSTHAGTYQVVLNHSDLSGEAFQVVLKTDKETVSKNLIK